MTSHFKEPTKRKPVLCYECSCPPKQCEYVREFEAGDYKNFHRAYKTKDTTIWIYREYKCPNCGRVFFGSRRKKKNVK